MKTKLWTTLLITITLLATFLSLVFFNNFLPLRDIFNSNIGKQNLITTIALIIAGNGMGIAGYVIQSITKNDLATPDTIGVTPLLSLLLIIASILGFNYFNSFMFSLIIILILSISIIFYIGRIKKASINLIVIGILFSTLIISINEVLVSYLNLNRYVLTIFNSQRPHIEWINIYVLGLIIVFVSLIILAFSKQIKIIENGETVGTTFGVNNKLVISIGVFSSVILAACSVMLVGVITFISLAGPLLVRYVIKDKYNFNLLFSILLTISFMLLGDTLMRFRAYFNMALIPTIISTILITGRVLKGWK